MSLSLSQTTVVKALFFLTCFLLVFRLRIGYYDLTIPLAFLALVLLIGARRLPRIFVGGITFLLSFVIYVYTVALVQEPTIDTHIVLKQMRLLLSFGAITFLTWFLVRHYRLPLDDAHRILALVLALHPLTILAQVFIPQFNIFWESTFLSAGAFNPERGRGLGHGTSMGGQLLGFIALYYFYLSLRLKGSSYAIGAMLTLPLYPMSALAGAAPFLVGFLYWVYKGGCNQVFLRRFFILSFLSSFSLFVILFFYSDSILAQRFQQGFFRVAAMLGLTTDYVQHGDPRLSQQRLWASYSLPSLDRPGQWLFGNAQEYGTHKTFSSDAGIVRFLHVYGIIGTALALSTIYWFVRKGRDPLLGLFLIAFLIMQYKNHMLFGRIVFDLFFLWWTLSVLETHQALRYREVTGHTISRRSPCRIGRSTS